MAKKITDKTFNDLKNYLKDHELDIYIHENDFGELENAFMEIMGRIPDNKWVGRLVGDIFNRAFNNR